MDLENFLDPTTSPITPPTEPIEDVVDPATAPADPVEPQHPPVDPVEPQEPQDLENPEEDDEDYTYHFKVLSEAGIFEEDEEFDGKFESLQEKLNGIREREKQAAMEELFSSFPQDFQPIIDYVKAGGSSVEEFLSLYTEPDIRNMDLENEVNQKAIIKRYFKTTTKYSDDKIDRMISKYAAAEELEDIAKESLQDLLELEEENKRLAIEQAAQQKQEYEARRAEYVASLNKSIDSFDTVRQRKAQLKNFMMAPVKADGGGSTTLFSKTLAKVYENPEHIAQLADVLLDYDEKKGFALDRYVKQNKTKEVSSVRKAIKDLENKPTRTSTRKTTQNNNNILEKFID